MNSALIKNLLLPISMILFGFIGVFVFGGYIEENRLPIPAGYEDEDLVFSGAAFKNFSLGLNGLIADWYWMQSLQYLGGKFAQKPDIPINVNDLRGFEPKLLYPLLDNAVSFDPQFIGVYEYGAVVLPSIDPALAVKIVEKGIENNPTEWRLYNQLGYIYWRTGEYEKAANAYEKASLIDGAPIVMKSMTAKMRLDGGGRETARVIYSQMFSEAQDSSTKKTAELFLLRLDALDQIDAINLILTTLKKENNRCSNDLREILPRLSKITLTKENEFKIDDQKYPVDPAGTRYVFNIESCTVEIDKRNSPIPH